MKKSVRVISALLGLALLFAVLFSVAFLAVNADHDCLDDGCPICLEIETCLDTLKTISRALAFVAVCVFLTTVVCVCLRVFQNSAGACTLVTLKVKFSD